MHARTRYSSSITLHSQQLLWFGRRHNVTNILPVARNSEPFKDAMVKRYFRLLLRNFTYVLYADIDELFLARSHTLESYVRHNSHRLAVAAVALELHSTDRIQDTPINWAAPIPPQSVLYSTNCRRSRPCAGRWDGMRAVHASRRMDRLNKMSLARVPLTFTHGHHAVASQIWL